MADLLRIRRDQVKSCVRGWLQYIDDRGTLKRIQAIRVEIVEEEAQSEDVDPAVAAEEAGDENTSTEGTNSQDELPLEPTLDQQFAATIQDSPGPSTEVTEETQAAAEPQPEVEPPQEETPKAAPKRAAKPKQSNGEPQVATAAKKTTAPKKKAAATNDSGAKRTIGGKAVDLTRYEKAKAPGGGVSYNNGDQVAKQLQGKTLDEVYGIVAKKIKAVEKELRSKFAHLNAGMQRMNLGNMLRKAFKST